ncbi:MAG: RtcB family protein [Candidatus Eiseniibacteriota bacterium]|nr:MAG: RtcB family protein [Candidatus Eisenbacteria bacterium]
MIPKAGGMRVPGIIYADEKMMAQIRTDKSPQQVANVAHLPGIVKNSLAMPDIHWGYGFPIGGVAATDVEEGVISPGGVGYDINCGVRLVTTGMELEEVRPRIKELVAALFRNIPSGVGSRGKLKLSRKEERKVLLEGSRWAIQNGYGLPEDLESTEEAGFMAGANPEVVSDRAYERGKDQLGTLGSGNHFLEVGYVEKIFEPEIAERFGLRLNQVTVIIHSGSRGFGYQICDDFLHVMTKEYDKLGIQLPDRQLACAYINSDRGREYMGAMACAVNYAYTNRQVLLHWTRETFERFFNAGPNALGMRLLYDLGHNVARREKHTVDGKQMAVCVHRKGAARAFPPGDERVPEKYRDVGQPVLIPGDMGTCSYLLVGTSRAMEETFGSTCHGAGRQMSRKQAMRSAKGRSIAKDLEGKGIFVMSASRATLAEEMPEAYKDVSDVVGVVDRAGISKKVARTVPIGVVKG